MTNEILKQDISMSNQKEILDAKKANQDKLPLLYECLNKLSSLHGFTGKSISSVWDDWKNSNNFGGVLRRETKA